ncbi:MAG: pyridoxal-phosphate dependent enzyme [Pseudomonadota bacterium]
MPVHTPDTPSVSYPSLSQIRDTAGRLAGKILHTPVWRWQTGVIEEQFDGAGEVWLKLELFQKTGTFKLRGALNCIEALDDDERRRGVVAVSAGNHAIAVAYTARLAGCSAKVVMPEYASPARIAACRDLGAQVLLMPDVHQAFAHGKKIENAEGRTMLHPFDGPLTAQGTATVGLELMAQIPGLDAVVVPVGGGGLCAGIAAAVKQINPDCAVYGVEPFGADALYRSFKSGVPETLERVDTVADSLGAPYAMAYSFGVCRRFVDDVVRVTDDEICRAMLYLFRDAKLVAEPAAAVATAALFGPLRDRLAGKKTALIVCGSNIDAARFAELLCRGAQVRDGAIPALQLSI